MGREMLPHAWQFLHVCGKLQRRDTHGMQRPSRCGSLRKLDCWLGLCCHSVSPYALITAC